MANQPLPKFVSSEASVQFFETHDMGDYDLAEVHFNVDITYRTKDVVIDDGPPTPIGS